MEGIVVLSKDKEGKSLYDYGEDGRDLIEMVLCYENGKLVDVKFSDVYLIIRDKIDEVVLSSNNDNVVFVLNRKKMKEVKLKDVEEGVLKIKLEVSNLEKFKENDEISLNLFVRC